MTYGSSRKCGLTLSGSSRPKSGTVMPTPTTGSRCCAGSDAASAVLSSVTSAFFIRPGLRESRDTAASEVVAGRPQDWDQRESVLRSRTTAAGALQGRGRSSRALGARQTSFASVGQQVLRACGAQDDKLARFGEGKKRNYPPSLILLKPRAALSRTCCSSTPQRRSSAPAAPDKRPSHLWASRSSAPSAPDKRPSHLWASRSFAPAALRMTSSLAPGREKRETTLPPSFSLNRARRCQGPAVLRRRNAGRPRLRRPTNVLRICGPAGRPRLRRPTNVLRICGPADPSRLRRSG